MFVATIFTLIGVTKAFRRDMIHVLQRIAVVVESFWHFSELNIKDPLSEHVQVVKHFLKENTVHV
jgi:hypothetical protein